MSSNNLNRLLNVKKKQRQKLKSKKLIKTPIDESMLSIREMEEKDKVNVQQLVSQFRQDYYINVYKSVFHSWFTYLITGLLLGISLTLMPYSTLTGIALPPVMISVYLIWKINAYKRANYMFKVNDMQKFNQKTSDSFNFKTIDERRRNQGVYLAFLKQGSLLI
jgi:hypothetical protein